MARATAQLPSYPVTVPSESGAPVTITDIANYSRSTTRGGVPLSNDYLYCVSFHAETADVHSVTFEIYHARADGSITNVKTLTRDGDFAPGVEIRSYQGEKVAGGGDRHALANCIPFSPAFGDERTTVVRPIRAELADGTNWVSKTPPAAVAPPIEVTDTAVPPPWDGAHHSGYIAVASGGGSIIKPEPQQIAIFAPQRQRASATITIAKCCVSQYGFDGSGNLIAASTAEGVLVFAPGATTATRRLPDHVGYVLAINHRGDIAIGGVNRSPDVAVYPAGGSPYRIAAAPPAGGLALSESGELAVIDQATNTVRCYPRGAVEPSRSFAFSGVPYARIAMGSLAYSHQGILAVQSTTEHLIRLYLPGQSTPVKTAPAAGAFAFDGDDDMIGISTLQTQIMSPNPSVPPRMIAHGGAAIAAEYASRRFAVRDAFRNELTIYETDGTQTLVPQLFRGTGVAISP